MVVFAFVAAMARGQRQRPGGGPGRDRGGHTRHRGQRAGFRRSSYGTLLGLPAIVLAGLVIGRNRGAYRVQAEQAAALLAQREQLQAEQRRADLLDERARIAREIHDVLAHSLGALGIQIQAARAVLTDTGRRPGQSTCWPRPSGWPPRAWPRPAGRFTPCAPTPCRSMRNSPGSPTPTRSAITSRSATTPAASPRPLPPDATVALLRVAQEALVNAAKHAAGQPVAVRLDYGDADVRLTVRNDLPPARGHRSPADVSTVNGGYGLTGMQERLRLLNGTLEAGRRDNQWIVTAELPRRQPETMAS